MTTTYSRLHALLQKIMGEWFLEIARICFVLSGMLSLGIVSFFLRHDIIPLSILAVVCFLLFCFYLDEKVRLQSYKLERYWREYRENPGAEKVLPRKFDWKCNLFAIIILVYLVFESQIDVLLQVLIDIISFLVYCGNFFLYRRPYPVAREQNGP